MDLTQADKDSHANGGKLRLDAGVIGNMTYRGIRGEMRRSWTVPPSPLHQSNKLPISWEQAFNISIRVGPLRRPELGWHRIKRGRWRLGRDRHVRRWGGVLFPRVSIRACVRHLIAAGVARRWRLRGTCIRRLRGGGLSTAPCPWFRLPVIDRGVCPGWLHVLHR